MLHRFLADRRGNIAMMFAVAAIPLLAATGAAIDYSRAYQQRMIIQDALDAAALAANQLIGLGKTDEEIEAEAQAFYNANLVGRLASPPEFHLDVDGAAIELTARLDVPTTFLGIVGLDELSFDLLSRTVAGSATYEIALVLDNSGSMSGTKITTLKTAAINLINTLYTANADNPKPDPVKFAVVPFAASVNVGTGNKTATWMGDGSESDGRSENFWHYTSVAGVDTKTYDRTDRFSLFTKVGIAWQGCVEERRMPYDVTDAAPDATIPDTMFIPMFAPDEPNDDWCEWEDRQTCTGSGRHRVCTVTHQEWDCDDGDFADFGNDWLDDYGGDHPDETEYADQEAAQASIAKYNSPTVYSGYSGTGQGPNLHCRSKPIMGLTTSQADTIAKINTLTASGNTNIMAGVTWGWRVLSPTEPFTGGRAYDTVDNHKIIILMTDGANTYNGENNFNKSDYSAFSYIINNHLGTTSRYESTIVEKMNDRTLLACENAKAAGIRLYTIAFQVTDEDALQILNDCASEEHMAYTSEDNAALLAAFASIASDIATLRIAE